MSTQTDRELLELAAKAAGYQSCGMYEDGRIYLFGIQAPWSPLTCDGDALRLAAVLKIDLEWQHEDNSVEAYKRTKDSYLYCPSYDACDYKRAIVDVAAKLGKEMP